MACGKSKNMLFEDHRERCPNKRTVVTADCKGEGQQQRRSGSNLYGPSFVLLSVSNQYALLMYIVNPGSRTLGGLLKAGCYLAPIELLLDVLYVSTRALLLMN